MRRLLLRLAAKAPPPGLEQREDRREELTGWVAVGADPEPLLRLGLCSTRWLERSLPSLTAAEATAPLVGEGHVHGDARSDNLCVRGAQAMLVDWNLAAIGNPLFDLISWLPSLHAEGDPTPETPPVAGASELVALVSSYCAARAGLPIIPNAPRARAARVLGLPPPDGSV